MERVTLNKLLQLKKEDLKGKLICFPTDTVYGVGAIATDVEACKKIYQMKQRSDKKPLPLLCSDIEQIKEYLSSQYYKYKSTQWERVVLESKFYDVVSLYYSRIRDEQNSLI